MTHQYIYIYITDDPGFIVCSFMENSIGMKRVKFDHKISCANKGTGWQSEDPDQHVPFIPFDLH